MRWAIAAFAILGSFSIFATLVGIFHADYSVLLWFPLAALSLLIGIPVTLNAVILGIVRASRNHQWGWLVAILLGTVLPVVAAMWVQGAISAQVATGVYPEQNLFVLLGIAVTFTPLAVGVYGVVSRRGNATETAARDAR